MRTLLIGIFILSLGFGFTETQRQITDYCERDKQREESKIELRPFRYTAFKTNRITVKGYPQREEIVFPIFYDSKYRFVFNVGDLPEGVQVQVFDKPESKSNRDVIWQSDGAQSLVTWDTPSDLNEDKLYIDFIIPASESEKLNQINKGCVVLLAGYQNFETVDMEDGSGDDGSGGFLKGLFGGGSSDSESSEE